MEDRMGVSIVILSLICTTYASINTVPVLLWTNSRTELHPALVGHTVSTEDFSTSYLQNVLKEKQNHILVTFVQDKLSPEDLTQNADVYNENTDGAAFHNLKRAMEAYNSVQLPSVDSPSSALKIQKEAFQGQVHELKAPYNIKDLQLDPNQSHLILTQLPPTGKTDDEVTTSLAQNDKIMGQVTKDLEYTGQPFTAVYTGERSSKVFYEPEKLYVGRHLLAEEDDSVTFLNVSGCIFFYAQEIEFIVTKVNDNPEFANFTLPSIDKPAASSSCKDNGSATLLVEYKDKDKLPSGLKSFSFKMEFSQKNRDWFVQSWTISYSATNNSKEFKGTDIPLNTRDIYAPETFSYHCTNSPIMSAGNATDAGYLKITNFQVQAGVIKNDKFGTPNDCTGFFTIPIWSGIICGAVLTAILAFGILMIMNISTMDRFDDPKGKTITVNLSD